MSSRKRMGQIFALAAMSIACSGVASAASPRCTVPSGDYTARSIGTDGVNNSTVASEFKITIGPDGKVTSPSPAGASYVLDPSKGQNTGIGKIVGICSGKTLSVTLSGGSITVPVMQTMVIQANAKPDPSQTIKRQRYYFDGVNANKDFHVSGWFD